MAGMRVTPNKKKLDWAHHRFLWAMGLCGALALGGCGGGDDDEEPVEEGRDFIIQGSFLQGTFDPEAAESLYMRTGISAGAGSGSTNLARWDMEKGVEKTYKFKRDYRYDNGRLYFSQARTNWGATNPDGNAFFMMGAGQGWGVALRQPEGGLELATSDLAGEFSCLRVFAQTSKIKDSVERLQWLTMNFTPGSESFDFTVWQDSKADAVGTSGTGTYKVEADGTLRIESDESVAMFTPGQREELLRAGGYQRDEQFLFALYLLAESKPSLSDILAGGKTSDRDEVPAAAFLACLKHGSALSLANLNGHYWYGASTMTRSPATGARTYNPTFGYLAADGAGSVVRKECQSKEVPRQFTMDALLEPDGRMLLTAGAQRWQGILSADGDIALVVAGENDGHMSYEIWMKAPAAISGCPSS